ncbi:serine hydrolase domain-containing protein [Flocculibacter collagenilyticus]|uniref:serine hydrolase domain-containing protein n=1 Tax=Flocculibacter collagenilyticus TaxID=2744479 RepID=UPI0022795B52|nr:serine hydrolase domain-containing protein [Flocculibacter collagenilyticus]
MLKRKKLNQLLSLPFVLLSFLLISCSQPKISTQSDNSFIKIQNNLDESVPKLMQQYHVPGVAIAIVDAHGVKLALNYGYTDNTKLSPVTEATIFEAASLGKPIFAHAVLQEHSSHLDKPLVSYLNNPIVAGELGQSITIRHLLSHTSGLAYSEHEQKRYVAYEPGSQWQYSGLGYSVMQQAVEQLSGTPLEDAEDKVLSVNLGMEDTSYLPPRKPSNMLAKGHDRRGNMLKTTPWRNANAGSSLHTNTKDYGRFLSRMLANFQSENITKVFEVMTVPHIEVDTNIDLHWGLGWAVAYNDSKHLFLHWGSNPGYKSLAIGSAKQDLAMVVLTNSDNGLELAGKLVPIVFEKTYPFLQFYMLHPDD